MENFLGLEAKLRELGVNSLEFKLFRLARSTGANDCQNHAIYAQKLWDLESPLLFKCQMYVYSGHALSYTKLVYRHATQTEGNKYFKRT